MWCSIVGCIVTLTLSLLATPLRRQGAVAIVDLAAQSRLPAMYPLKEYVKFGGLMAYGWSIPALSPRSTAATMAAKGARNTVGRTCATY